MLPFLPDPVPKLVLIGGKGGVGKSTLSAATAVHVAQGGTLRVIVASSDPAHSLGDVLGLSLEGVPTAVPGIPNLRALHVDARDAWGQLMKRHREELARLLSDGLELDAGEIDRLLQFSIPGLDEIMALLEVERMSREEGVDVLVLDTAPTGHTIRLLELPDLLPGWLTLVGSLREKQRYLASRFGGAREDGANRFIQTLLRALARVRNLLRDPARSRFVPVMLPDRVVAEETERLIRSLLRLRIPLTHVVVNHCDEAGEGAERLAEKYPTLTFVRYPTQGEEVVGAARLISFLQGTGPSVRRAEQLIEPAVLKAPASSIRFVLVAGKGGVGKSTVASAIAIGLRRILPLATRILLTSTDPAHSLADVLNELIEHEAKELVGVPGVWAEQADPLRLLEELKRTPREEVDQLFKGIGEEHAVDLPFERHVLTSILDLVPPGLDEAMALAQLSDAIERREFGMVVLDTAPTGHLLRLLETPDLAKQWLGFTLELFVKRGLITRLPRTRDMLHALTERLECLKRLLSSSETCHAVVVCTEGRVVLAETERLIKALGVIGIAPRAVVLNRARMKERSPLPLPSHCELIRLSEHARGPSGVEELAALLRVK